MTVCQWWPLAAQELSEVAADVDVGLHLTLTDQKIRHYTQLSS